MVSRKGRPELRDAHPDEAALLRDLACRSLAWWSYDAERLAAWQPPADITESFVAEVGGEIAGWAGLRKGVVADQPELAALYVDPAMMRRGIGALLLAEARRRAMRAGARCLVVVADPNADSFFRETGGRACGRKPDPALPGGEASRFEYPLELVIRLAERDDADDISELVGGLAGAFLLEPDAADDLPLLRSFTPEAISRYVTGDSYWYYLGEIGGRIIGVAALRDDGHAFHLFHLFVAPQWQGLGIAARLWEAVRDAMLEDDDLPPDGAFMVNSALGAVPVYERFGFVALGPPVEKNGIAFVPMKLPVAQAR